MSLVPALLVAVLHASLQEPAPDPSLARLEASPRHHEWITVRHGERAIRAFVAFPERAGKTPAVLVIHENKGLTDWVRAVADRLAEAGYLAVAPDLLTGEGPDGGDTSSFPGVDAATKALYARADEEVNADLAAVADHARGMEACDGTLAVAGFCWGGSRSFDLATRRDDLAAAFVFYGRAPEDPAALERIACPVYGFYGEDDARVNASIEPTRAAMEERGKRYEPVIYAGAGHGFLRRADAADAEPALAEAGAAAWKRWLERLAELR